MSQKVLTEEKFRALTFLINLCFFELGLVDNYLEDELFSLVCAHPAVKKTFDLMMKTGWKFESMAGSEIWIWSKQGRDHAYLLYLPFQRQFLFLIDKYFGWQYSECYGESNTIVSEGLWEELEKCASKKKDSVWESWFIPYNEPLLRIFV